MAALSTIVLAVAVWLAADWPRLPSGVLTPANAAGDVPEIMVAPLAASGLPDHKDQLDLLQGDIQSALARFRLIKVLVDEPSAASSPAKSAADYRLVGTVQNLQLRYSLIDDRSELVWSQAWQIGTAQQLAAARATIATEVVKALLSPRRRGAHARDRQEPMPPSRSALCANEIRNGPCSAVPVRRLQRAIACLERETAADPYWALGFPDLAALYGRQFEYGWGPLWARATPCSNGR